MKFPKLALRPAVFQRKLICAALLGTLSSASAQARPHPLDPLSTNELSAVAQVLRTAGKADTNDIFPLIALHEPPKETVYAWKPDEPFPREGFAMVFDPRANKTFEAVVDLPTHSVVSWKPVPDVQPMWTSPEDEEAISLIRANPEWQLAMKQRGITNFTDVTISTWISGHHLPQGQKEGRFYRALFNLQRGQTNLFGPPIEGVEAILNLKERKVLQVIDTGRRPIPSESTDFFDEKVRGTTRPALKPLTVVQPQGPSFVIDGNEIQWDRWRFRYGFDAREGLILYLVRYQDEGRERSILYRASMSEMFVPYGDPDQTWFWRNALDEGEYGLGKCAAPLLPGRNTAAHATLLDVSLASDLGVGELLPQRIDLYEREGDTLWTHFDYLAEVTEARRSRELVIGYVATEGSYDYGFHWIFRQDGTLEFVVDLSGIILTKGVVASQCEICRQRADEAGTIEPTGEDRFGTLVAPHTVGVNHQHFFNMRLDFDIDGTSNSVAEVNVRAERPGRGNPQGNAFIARRTVFGTEREAMRDLDLATQRTWMIFNPNFTTALGHFPAYCLEPENNALPFLASQSVVRKSAGFVDHHFFATRYHPSEMNAAGPYPVYAAAPQNLITWTRNNESILNQDVVVWYTFGLTHITRPEDYPVMPSARVGFKLAPKGFFVRNPSLDVVPPP